MEKEILVTRSSMPPLDEYVDEIKELWDSHWLTNMGVKHEKFREELCKYLGVSHIELLTNGHMAIEMTLQSFAFPVGSQVITTPFTFASTTHAIVRNNLVPVFCDINEDDYTMDTDMLESLITDKTVAILPVHVYGNICNIEKIDEIAKRHNLKIIYDAAHAFGESYKGNGVGNFGDASCFSFHATKVFNSIEGGAVCYKDESLGKEIYTLKNFGIKNEVTVDGVGANAKMNEFCAAMGICNLRHIEEEIEKRKKISNLYYERLSEIKGIKLNYVSKDMKCNYSYFPIVIDPDKYGITRDDLYDKLVENGIRARKYFYPITSEFECYKDKYDASKTPVALRVSKRVLTLPIYADLPLEDVERICQIIKER